MNKPLIMGNWKMNATHLEAIQMVQKLHYRLDVADYERVDVVVAPPFTSLRSIQTVIEADHMRIGLGAQNVHAEPKGAYTGEVSVPMLSSLHVGYVIVGHSERRAMFGEDDSTVNAKAKAVIGGDMIAVVCVGETLDQREAGEADDVVTSQLRGSLAGLSVDDLPKLVIAYEPVWAIGTGRSASADDAGEMASSIRRTCRTMWGEDGASVRILYGGSVNQGNVGDIMAKRDVDGALVGGASLDPDTFAGVVRYWV